jgi:3-methyladenine DNA glycosylase Mpg
MDRYLIKKPSLKRPREDDTTTNEFETASKKVTLEYNLPPSQQLVKLLEKTLESNVTTDTFTTAFSEVADYLVNHVVLTVAGKHQCRIAEFEMYYTTKDTAHPDPFTHQHPGQLSSGAWYFHRENTSANALYKSGTWKGLDIAIGSKTPQIHGGILIRSLLRLENKQWKLVDGPCNCVDFILNENGIDSTDTLAVSTFVQDKLNMNLNIEQNDTVLSLSLKKDTKQMKSLFALYNKIYTSSRVGLTLKKSDHALERQTYIMKPYRYFIVPQLMKKGKANMICTQFYLDYMKGKESADKTVKVTDSIKKKLNQTFSVSVSSVDTYLKDFMNGRKLKNADKFKGQTLTTVLLCELAGYCSIHYY